jgi:hypothetical protein
VPSPGRQKLDQGILALGQFLEILFGQFDSPRCIGSGGQRQGRNKAKNSGLHCWVSNRILGSTSSRDDNNNDRRAFLISSSGLAALQRGSVRILQRHLC